MSEIKNFFPLHETFTDCCGQERLFIITADEVPVGGWVVRAEEADSPDLGYEFAAYAVASPYQALGLLRFKVRRELATRYLDPRKEDPEPLHQRLRGHIGFDATTREIVLVVDGRAVSMNQLQRIFGMHEGWSFDLVISDRAD